MKEGRIGNYDGMISSSSVTKVKVFRISQCWKRRHLSSFQLHGIGQRHRLRSIPPKCANSCLKVRGSELSGPRSSQMQIPFILYNHPKGCFPSELKGGRDTCKGYI